MTTRRHFLLGAAATAAAATLAACSQDVPVTPSVTTSATPRPVLDADRLTAILERIDQGLSSADSAKNREALAGYLTGPAARGDQATIDAHLSCLSGDSREVYRLLTEVLYRIASRRATPHR